MEWTYTAYTGVNIGISVGLCVIVTVGVIVAFVSSKKGREFVNERILGVDPRKIEDEDDIEDSGNDSLKKKPSEPSKKSVELIGGYFCILAAMSLTITAILIFQGCFLANARLVLKDHCPEYPMDCFIFNDTTANPITNNVSFRCTPLNTTQFPNSIPDLTAWCFGWIIKLQTTKNVLDQLGVCTGLLGLFTTLLAIIIYLGKSKKTLVLSITFILCSGTAIILLLFFKWSFAPLTHAVLILGIGLGFFGISLFCVLPKKIKKNNNEEVIQSDRNKSNRLSNPVSSSPISLVSTVTSASRPKVFPQSSKVTPK